MANSSRPLANLPHDSRAGGEHRAELERRGRDESRSAASQHPDAERGDGSGLPHLRVELNDDELIDGFLVSQDNDAVILRIPNSEDRRIPRKQIQRANFVRRSLMPEGLLEALPEKDATDLLAYLRTLK